MGVYYLIREMIGSVSKATQNFLLCGVQHFSPDEGILDIVSVLGT